MKKEIEKLGLISEDISDENVNFHELEPMDEDDEIIHSVEDPKVQESLASVNSDDSVKIYLQQMAKFLFFLANRSLNLPKRFTKHRTSFQKIFL